MANIFFKKIEIELNKCFEKASIELNCPDGTTAGSGLNILIGENGTGKTSILDAINFLTQSKYSTENKLSINDYYNHNNPIKIFGYTDDFKCKSSIDFYKDYHFETSGIIFEAKPRDRKEANKLLSSPFVIKNHFHTDGGKYYKGADQKNDIDSRDISFSDNRIIDGSIDVFYFDKNRSRHLVSGTYKTTFDRKGSIQTIISNWLDTVLPKSAKPGTEYQFPTPAGVTWEQLAFEFTATEMLLVTCGHAQERLGPEQVKMKDQRSGKRY